MLDSPSDAPQDRPGGSAIFFVNDRPALIMTYSSFFDESERLEAGDPLCVAGFVFKDVAYKQFCRAWDPFLRAALDGRGIQAMHMTDLIQGKGEFKGIDIPSRLECLEQSVDIVCGHGLLATGVDCSAIAPQRFRQPAVRAFGPVVAKMIRRFNVNSDSMIRIISGDALRDFVNEQRARPVEQDIRADAGPAKRKFR
jgi:hypothetical protein